MLSVAALHAAGTFSTIKSKGKTLPARFSIGSFIKNKDNITSKPASIGATQSNNIAKPYSSDTNLNLTDLEKRTETFEKQLGSLEARAADLIQSGWNGVSSAELSDILQSKQDLVGGNAGDIVTYTAVDGKLGSRGIDTVVTTSSGNLITSGAVKIAIEQAINTKGENFGTMAFKNSVSSADLAAVIVDSLSKADTAVQPSDLSLVATSGSYDDLSDRPAIVGAGSLTAIQDVSENSAGQSIPIINTADLPTAQY
ncbi:MAG: hypothetical protein LBD94_00675 [Rickettsiales bacterium]|nr:hypothetical protein [Rickettsiales bacterium]